MPTSAQIKERAKLMLRAHYGVSVAAFLVFTVISVLATYTYVGAFFVMIPLELGLLCYFLMLYQGGTPTVSVMFHTGFGINYLRKIGGILWMGLWIFLWSLLFYIPGIVKAYSYSMTPYLLAAYPDIKAKDALRLSMRIMDGHKMELFILQLSFIGWMLLSSLTCGILLFLYVGPYMQATFIGYYCELLDFAVKCNVVTPEELNGAPLREY